MQKNKSDNVTHEDVTVVDLMAYRLKKCVENAQTDQEQDLALNLQSMYLHNEIDIEMDNGSMYFKHKEEPSAEDNTEDSRVVIIDLNETP